MPSVSCHTHLNAKKMEFQKVSFLVINNKHFVLLLTLRNDMTSQDLCMCIIDHLYGVCHFWRSTMSLFIHFLERHLFVTFYALI